MYFFVPYNLSPIQQGIQAGHAALRFAIQHPEEAKDFVENHETWVILNGGTTNSSPDEEHRGSLNVILDELTKAGVKRSYFEEPDLNNALSAVCFIADERVYDKENYPDWDGSEWAEKDVKVEPHYSYWVESIGGKQNAFLRELLNGKKLA